MKKFIVLAVILTLMVIPISGMAASKDKVYTLKVADPFPIKHPLNKIAKYFMAEAEKASNGRIKFKYYPAQQLGKLKDLLKITQQGMTDIAYVGMSFFPAQFNLNLVMNLPYYTSAAEGSQIYLKLLKTSPEIQKEWDKNKVRPLFLGVTNQYDVGSINRPFNSPADLKGLRVRVAGGLFETIAKRYGMVPITMASNEIYEALQRGILDGTVLTLPSVRGYRLNEMEKYHTLGMRLGGFVGGYAISLKSYRKLPPELQKALDDAGLKTTFYFAKVWDGMVDKLVAAFEKGGMKFTKITPEMRAEWDAPLKGLEEEWIKKLEAKGLPARKVFNQFEAIAKEIVK